MAEKLDAPQCSGVRKKRQITKLEVGQVWAYTTVSYEVNNNGRYATSTSTTYIITELKDENPSDESNHPVGKVIIIGRNNIAIERGETFWSRHARGMLDETEPEKGYWTLVYPEGE